MAPDSRVLIAIAGEDQAHRVLATRLLDRVLLERAAGGWPSQAELDHCRVVCGWRDAEHQPEHDRYYKFQSLKDDLQAQLGRRFFQTPRIDGEPAGKALWFIQLYRLFALRQPRPHVLIGVRDTSDASLDEAAERAKHYIRQTLGSEMIVVFALPFQDAEAWFIAGLTAATTRRDDARKQLNFDPIAEAHKLTAQPNTAETDAKRVLRFLLGEGRTLREAHSVALPGPDLDALAERTLTDLALLGQAERTGLARFLATLRTKVAPRVLPGSNQP
jgi:hypothetical protein